MNTQNGENDTENWARYMEVLILDGKLGEGAQTKAEVGADPATMFPGNNRAAARVRAEARVPVSAGLPTTTLERVKSDLVVVRVTDETVPDAGKKRYALSLSIHGIERAGAEGGTRAMEDLVTAFTDRARRPADPARGRRAGRRPTFARGPARRRSSTSPIRTPTAGAAARCRREGGRVLPALQRQRRRPQPRLARRRLHVPPLLRAVRARDARVRRLLRRRQGASGGPFAAGDDLHGQPFADALSYTLLPHGSHDFAKDPRIRETAIDDQPRTLRGGASVVADHPAERRSDAGRRPDRASRRRAGRRRLPADLRPDLGLGLRHDQLHDDGHARRLVRLRPSASSADGIDNEMSFSHLDKNIAFDPHTEQLHVDGNKALIYAHLADMLDPVSGAIDAPGRKGYVPNERLKRDEQDLQPRRRPRAPRRRRTSTARPRAQPGRRPAVASTSSPSSADAGKHLQRRHARQRDRAELPGRRRPGSATLQVQCRGCDDHAGVRPEADDEWVTVAEDYNQSPRSTRRPA